MTDKKRAMTKKLKPQKLADVTFVDAKGRERKRYTVRHAWRGLAELYIPLDKLRRVWLCRAGGVGSGPRAGFPYFFRDRKRAWAFLKRTTEADYNYRCALAKLDRQ